MTERERERETEKKVKDSLSVLEFTSPEERMPSPYKALEYVLESSYILTINLV